MEEQVIKILADKHQDWIYMAKSFGVSDDDANELVQQMYIRICGYVKDVSKIMYNDDEVNTYYVYVTLRNLYLSNFHKLGNKFVYSEDLPDEVVDYRNYESGIEEQKEQFDKVIDKVEAIVDDWYWYDKRVFNIHFYDKMSMRKIARETKISLSSIFNTLSNGKKKIKEGAIEEYKRYRESKD
jgi:DNA-directed RNA polymerase specialized sigma24 family protein